jgi:MFS transporter, PPP family, 3-phenylpropionic acid transporter
MPRLVGSYFVTGIAGAVLLPFITPALSSRGFSPEDIGLLLALASVAVVVFVPTWGYIGDSIAGHRRALQGVVLLSCLAALGLGMPLALPLVGAALVCWYSLQAGIPPLLDAIAMDALGERRDTYGRLRLLQSLSFAVVVFGVGVVYNQTGYQASYLVYVLTAAAVVASVEALPDRLKDSSSFTVLAVGDTATSLLIDPDGSTLSAGPLGKQARQRISLGAIDAGSRTSPPLRRALAAVFVTSIGVFAASSFLPLRMYQLGAAPSIIALSATVSALFEIPIMLLGHRLVGALGLRGLFGLGCLMYVLAAAAWMTVDDPVQLMATRAVSGLGYGAFTVSSVVAVSRILPAEYQASGQALRQSAISAGAVLGSVGGGLVYGRLGAATFFAMAACLPTVGATLAMRWLPARGYR